MNFKELVSIDVNDHVEKRDKFSYLSWSYAWQKIKEIDINANYEVIENADGLPYFKSDLGYFVKTAVTFQGITHKMLLPVLNTSNKVLLDNIYKYKVWDKSQNKYVEKTVEKITAFDINKAVLRCLVKTIALHGLGLYLYQGEDLPPKFPENELLPLPEETPELLPLPEEIKKPLPVGEVVAVPEAVKPSEVKKQTIQDLKKALGFCSIPSAVTNEINQYIKTNDIHDPNQLKEIEILKGQVIKLLDNSDDFFKKLKTIKFTEVYAELNNVKKYYPVSFEMFSFIKKVFENSNINTLEEMKALRAFIIQKNAKLSDDKDFNDYFESKLKNFKKAAATAA